jgi:hypothetical protein
MEECRWLTPLLVEPDDHLLHSRFITRRDDKKGGMFERRGL